MSKPSRVLVVVGVLAMLCALMIALGMHSGNRGGLRAHLAELRAKGEKLTYADLMRGRLTNGFDTHAVITNAAAQLRIGKLSPLGPGILELRRYVGPGQALVTWNQGSPVWTTQAGSGTWEEMDADMEANQAALQKVRDALQTPAPDAGPYTNVFTTRRIEFVSIRNVAHWLACAADCDLHQGRLEPALQNIEALAGLARMERDEPILVAQMVRISVAGLGLAATWEALQAPGWTEPQLQRLQEAWTDLNLLDAAERGFVGERVGGYELLGEIRRFHGPHLSQLLRVNWNLGPSSSKPSFERFIMEYVYMPAYKLTSVDKDELLYLRTMQEALTGMRMLQARRPWAEAKQRLDQTMSNVNAIATSPQRVRYIFSIMAIPNFLKACEAGVHAETERQMTLAAIALKRYQLRHGHLPPRLEALVPEFLPAKPYDYMGAKPLGFRLKADGNYVLYSVGDDGKDDGGDPTPAAGALNGMWTGRDAVWPSPAAESGDSNRAVQTPRPRSSYR